MLLHVLLYPHYYQFLYYIGWEIQLDCYISIILGRNVGPRIVSVSHRVENWSKVSYRYHIWLKIGPKYPINIISG